jgi:hypothetical protein
MLRRMTSIFLCFCIWNKTGLIDDPTWEYENMGKIEFQKNLSKSRIADKSIDNCEKIIKITPEKLFLTKDRPRNVVCSKVIIVGPYPTEEFVKAVKRDLKPEIIYVNVDESWKPKEIDSIKEIESVKLIPVRTENGIGMFMIKQPGVPLTYKLEKMELQKDKFIFYKNEDIKEIKVKKFALLNNKKKSIFITTNDKKKYVLYSDVDEPRLQYHNDNFSKFIEKYSAK